MNVDVCLALRVQAAVSDAIDKNVALAEQLRDMRKTLCSSGSAQDDALEQVLTLLARQ